MGCATGAPFNVIPPIVKDSNPAAYFLSPGGAGFGNAILRSFHIASTEGISFDSVGGPSSISVPDWTAPPNAPQPNGKTLDTLDGRFVSQTQQVGTALWNVHPINVGGFSRVRLYQFDQTATAPLFIFTPSSVAGTNNDHLFNPSVAVDGPSNLAFITASRTIPADPQNGKPGMLIFKGSANSDLGWLFHVVRISPHQYVTCTTDPCRWGDYSAMQIDPSNHTRAWGFNQIVTGPSDLQWSTRAAKVR